MSCALAGQRAFSRARFSARAPLVMVRCFCRAIRAAVAGRISKVRSPTEAGSRFIGPAIRRSLRGSLLESGPRPFAPASLRDAHPGLGTRIRTVFGTEVSECGRPHLQLGPRDSHIGRWGQALSEATKPHAPPQRADLLDPWRPSQPPALAHAPAFTTASHRRGDCARRGGRLHAHSASFERPPGGRCRTAAAWLCTPSRHRHRRAVDCRARCT